MTHPGYFLTIEGIEGVGKTTCLSFIQQHLQKANVDFIVTREPGGTPIAEAIRKILLSPHEEIMLKETELLLMFASRAQHLATVIKPALESGQWVVCDRFTDASYAYQGAGRQIPIEQIASLESWIQGSLRPNVTFLLDAPVKVALKRARQRKSVPDRIEAEEEEFFSRVRQGYLNRAQLFPKQYKIIDASRPKQFVKTKIYQLLDELIGCLGSDLGI